ncbi:MAG: hypothetical protein K9J81_02595 [Desulfohalobiaceae bacterium]|nr:hypothetical protein [Desulfohalobiaceae bacterium]
MNTPKTTDDFLLRLLNNLPVLSGHTRSRGPSFLVFWAHRLSGLILVLYFLFHLLTLSSLVDPAVFTAKMAGFTSSFFTFLEFFLAVPLLFHALNGLRLILYESFGCRETLHLRNWLGSLGLIFMLILGLLMGLGSERVSPLLFALVALVPGLMLSAYLFQRLRRSPLSRLWKGQRLSAAFLLFALPGHMLFMHLNHDLAHEAANILARLQLPLVQIFYLLTMGCGLYHAVYGLSTLFQDLAANRALRSGLTAVLLLGTAYLLFLGLQITFFLGE